MYESPFHRTDLSNYSFLITGGAGFIGSNIVQYLIKHNAGKVRVLDNFSTGSRENVQEFIDNPAFELMEGDIRDLEMCRAAVDGVDFVSHQAALGSVPRSINDPITTNEVNISGFLNMLVAARDQKVKRLIYAASSSTYGDHIGLPKVEDAIGKPLSPYAITKYVNELYAGIFSEVYGFHALGLRYFNVFGPRQDPFGPYAAVIPLFIKAALDNDAPYINGDGTISRDFTFVENAVQANIRALFKENLNRHEVINVACGESISLNDLWTSITAIESKEIKPIYRQERKGDIKHSLADVTKGKDLIGYIPSVKVKEGLSFTYSWYKTTKR
ncbi:SDR family oxidoreductase [Chitinophaga tropicalis]|uniref:NAD-dependent epimerase/dehydratase family protein n=1 Tax=Chitinophaga tropicalis TaxID=2683588 RepID=A0A7K1U3E8_9BACT|nr:SDR family oxidoreductase [Chitinophaga tropicalis]MVT08892.1 NAD-dependent epimerase/dehydratase family protein [Chitinophaga tropicalis]